MEEYLTINKVSKLLGVSPQTLRNWDKSNKLKPHHISVNGYRYYSKSDLNKFLKIPATDRITIGYCRISTHKQKEDLDRQIEKMNTYLLAQGKPYKIISDIGSGMNYNRKGLQELIKQITENKVDKVVVLYKDRLLRFGFELVEYIAELYHCKIEVADNTEKTDQQELVEDFVQTITAFRYKLQGKKADKAKKMIKELTEDDKNSEIY